jgi:hypothetical protein
VGFYYIYVVSNNIISRFYYWKQFAYQRIKRQISRRKFFCPGIASNMVLCDTNYILAHTNSSQITLALEIQSAHQYPSVIPTGFAWSPRTGTNDAFVQLRDYHTNSYSGYLFFSR